jgi:hypothetical protein
MKKQILSEEFKRMQKIAGLITENDNYPKDDYPYELGEPHPSAVYPAGGAWHTLSTGTSIDIGEDPYHGQYETLTKEEHEEVIELLNNYIEQYEENFGGTEYYNKDVVDLAKYIVKQHQKKILSLNEEFENLEEVDSKIIKLANKIENLPIIDKLANKIESNPKAMDSLNKLVAMYGVNESLTNLDLRTIINKSKNFSDKVNEEDATFTASGVFGGPLLLGLTSLIPGAMENIMQTVNTVIGMGDTKAYEPAFILSVVGGILVGLIIDKIKNKTNENISYISKSDFKNMIREMILEEAKKDEKEEEDIEIEDDETVDTEETPEGNPDDILNSLKTALNGAKALGDEKLIDQIGNTITFYTRVHIVGQENNINEVNTNTSDLPQEIINDIVVLYTEDNMDIEDIADMYRKKIIDFLQGYDPGLDYDI